MSKMRTLILRNSEWARGKKRHIVGNALLNEDGTMCCLGIDAVARRIPKQLIKDRSLPSSIDSDHDSPKVSRYRFEWMAVVPAPNDAGYSVELEELAAEINDDYLITDRKRVSLLRPIFAKLGIKLEYRAKE